MLFLSYPLYLPCFCALNGFDGLNHQQQFQLYIYWLILCLLCGSQMIRVGPIYLWLFSIFFSFQYRKWQFFMWHNNKMKMNVYTPIRRCLCNRVNGRTISLPFCLRWSQFKPPRVLNNSFFLLKRTMNLCANPFIRRRLKTCFFSCVFFFG